MEFTKKNIIGNYARYTGRSGAYHHALVEDITITNNVKLSFMPDNKRKINFTRELKDLIFFPKLTWFEIGDTVYYYSNKCHKFNPATVEGVDADPANGVTVQLRAIEYGKTVIFETGLSSIHIPVIWNPKTEKFIVVKIP